MAAQRRPGHARVVFDELLWNEDLAHSTPAAADNAARTRRQLEGDGVAIDRLRRCDEEGRDGTFGVRHPAPARGLSVYQVADRRLRPSTGR